MRSIEQSLEGILRWHSRHGRNVQHYSPGLSEAEIREQERKFGLKFPQSVFSMYQFRNGSDGSLETLRESYIVPGFVLNGLAEAVGINGTLRNVPEYPLEKSYLPFLEDCGGTYYVIECSTRRRKDGKVILLDEGQEILVHKTLSSMWDALSECFEHGAIVQRNDSGISWDHARKREIMRRLNPEIRFWKNADDQTETTEVPDLRQMSNRESPRLKPDEAFAKVVGHEPITFVEAAERLFAYVRENKLHDTEDKTVIHTDALLLPIFNGQDEVTIFGITQQILKHLSPL